MDIRQFLKERVDVVKFVSMSVALEPTVGHFQGICPMCDELYPSLNIYPDEKRFECFRCGATGDVLDFAMKVMGIEEEKVAVEWIASIFEIEELKGPEESKRGNGCIQAPTNNLNIIEGRTNIIHPAQDFKKGVGYVSVILKVEREERGIRRPVNLPHIVTSEKKIIPVDNHRLLESNGVDITVYPVLPHKESRWSYRLLQQYLSGKFQADPEEIFARMICIYDRFMDFPEAGTSLILALWSIGTYFFKIFESYPYLYIHGTKGSGKTKCLLVACQVCFNSLMGSDITKPALFRTVEGSSPTIFIDEAEQLKGRKKDEELVRLLNAGYKRGNAVGRVNTQTFEVQWFDLYSPKMLAGIKGLDSVLEDRCIDLTMIKTMDPRKANLAVAEREEDWGEIRHLQYCFALDHFKGIMVSYERVIANIEPGSLIQDRKGELWFPLLSIAFYIDSYGKSKYYVKVKAFAEKSIKEAEQDSLDEWSTALLLALERMFKEKLKETDSKGIMTVRLSEVEKEMRGLLEEKPVSIPLRWIGQQMKRLKLGTKKRTKNGMEYTINLSELKDRMERYMPKKED